MRLPKPFFRLPVQLDAARLHAEISALPDSAWQPHPNHIPGNECVRLISVDGGENDLVHGRMAPTPHLEGMPYLRQALASFGVVWSRSRLMRLAPHSTVPEHADINHHWFSRVRVHIPIQTNPAVRFYCAEDAVHMAAGEAWVFDNWRLHRVENRSDLPRVHLVADTSGSAAFWQFVASSEHPEVRQVQLAFDPASTLPLRVERAKQTALMPPAELDLLVQDLGAELETQVRSGDAPQRLAAFLGLLDAFRYDWRQLYVAREDDTDLAAFVALRDRLRELGRAAAEGLAMRTNRVAAAVVLEGRITRALIGEPDVSPAASSPAPARRVSRGEPQSALREPLFIIAAPRSGSTLLFETLAVHHGFCSIGGEAHELIEGLAELRPGTGGVDSNRLSATEATENVITRLRERFAAALVDSAGRRLESTTTTRLLEKTPKNALRIPLLDRVFPGARYLFLWRDPRPNLHSIIRAWESGRWKTYAGLPGRADPWSLLLPPGWQHFADAPLPRIAAFQWDMANRTALDDLASLPDSRWMAMRYEDFVADPATVVAAVLKFAGMPMDDALQARLSAPLPWSRHTLSAPDPDKWRSLDADIRGVESMYAATWQRLQALPLSSR